MQDAEADAFEEAFNPSSEPAPAAMEKDTEAADEGEQPRDEHGRFAGKEPVEAEEADQAEKPDDGGSVPPWRLREMREERDRDRSRAEQAERQALEYQRRLAFYEQQQRQAAQQQVEPPDPVYDPAGYRAFVAEAMQGQVKGVEQMVRDRMIDMTFAEQHEQHGKTFEEAYSGLQQAKAHNDPEFDRIINAPNPGKALMKWHRNQVAMNEVGGDLDGFLARKRDEWLKDPKVREQVIQQAREEANGSSGRSSNVTDLPSLNRAPGGAGNRNAGLGDSDEERFDNAFAPRRRG